MLLKRTSRKDFEYLNQNHIIHIIIFFLTLL